MIQRAAISAVVCLALLARVAVAHPMDWGRRSAPTAPAPTLQQILDGLVVSGPPIDASAPINVELWQNSSGPMTAQVVLDFTSKRIKFGMYDPDHVDDPVFMLRGMMKPADVATVTFNDDDSITVQGGGHRKNPQLGFEGPFGFVVKNFDSKHKHKGDNGLFFTQDALNPGGSPRALVFQGNGQTMLKLPGLAPGLFLPGQFLIAWETGLGDANDGKFNDFLVLVSNIVPVTAPEPAFALLLGISSLALICGRRARSA
jgi:hypothetical protein